MESYVYNVDSGHEKDRFLKPDKGTRENRLLP
jgi:hypothetical protein